MNSRKILDINLGNSYKQTITNLMLLKVKSAENEMFKSEKIKKNFKWTYQEGMVTNTIQISHWLVYMDESNGGGGAFGVSGENVSANSSSSSR